MSAIPRGSNRLIVRQSVGWLPKLWNSVSPALASLLLGTTIGLGAELPVSNPYVPRPYGALGLSINGGGYQPISELMGAGFRMDSPNILLGVELGYGNARKANDATLDNHSGHERTAQARAFYKTGTGFYAGGGLQWSQTSTTNYSKQAWRPTVGGGKDFVRNTYSLRLEGVYILPGSDRANGNQGPEVSLTYPSPAYNHHLFFRSVLLVYRFHTTDTFSDRGTSTIQEGDHHIAAKLTYSLLYRF